MPGLVGCVTKSWGFAGLLALAAACADGGEAVLPVEPLQVATAAGDACAAVAPDRGIHASYRKDAYLPSAVYSEPTETPLDGGRVQIAALAERSCTVEHVRIDGQEAEALVAAQGLEWYHVWPRQVIVDEPVWVAFHSRDAKWDRVEQARVEVLCAAGAAVDGSFAVRTTDAPLGYVTFDDDLQRMLIHVENRSDQPRLLASLLVDGREVFTSDVAAVASPTVPARGSALWTVPLCAPAALGEAWTVVARYGEAAPAVGAGRVLKPHFPIEAWPASSDCPLPGVDDEAFALFHQGGIDTLYMYYGSADSCGYDRHTMLAETLPARGDTFLLLGDDFDWADPPPDALPDTSAVLGFLTGDESDWDIYDDDGHPNPDKKARKARALWDRYPELATYNGAMTNKHIGTFAGMTDIQGIDLYAAGCAPHILQFGHAPPLRAPYDYLRNARNNHMPLPTWLYAQGLGTWADQPNPAEVLTQALMVAAAGGKGLMWFQARQGRAEDAPQTWAAMVRANRLFRGVRWLLRRGDITGLARSAPDTIVEAIRAPEALVVVLINLAHDAAPSDEACLEAQLGTAPVPHFELVARRVSVRLPVPDDVRVADVYEVTADGPRDLVFPLLRQGRELEIADIALDTETPVRLFVLAADPALRQQTAAAIGG